MKKKFLPNKPEPEETTRPRERPETVDNPPPFQNEAVRGRDKPAFNPSPDSEDDEQRQLEDILASDGIADGYVNLYRRTLTETKPAYLDRLPVSNFSLETVKNVYGGGEYTAKIFTSQARFFRQITFIIDHQIPATHPRAVGSRDAQQHGGSTDEMIRLILAREAQPKPAAPDNRNDMTAIFGLVGIILKSQSDILAAALAGRPSVAPSVDANNELVRELIRAQKPQSPKDWIESFSMLQNLRDGKEPTGETGGFAGFLGDAAAAFMAKMGGNPLAPGPNPPALPAPITLPPAPNRERFQAFNLPSNPESMTILQAAVFHAVRDQLLNAAQANRDPREFVATMIGQIPEKYDDAIFAQLSRPDWFEMLQGFDSRATAFRPWLEKVRAAILEELKGDDGGAAAATDFPVSPMEFPTAPPPNPAA